MRQIHELLGIPPRMFSRDHRAVGNHIIHETRPGRSRISEIIHLYWRWSVSKNIRSAVTRITRDINENVDLIVRDFLRGRDRGYSEQLIKLIEAFFQTLA